MSTGLSQVQVIDFDAQVKAAYQATGRLRPHVRVKTGIVGASTTFRRYGRGVARVRIPQTDVVPMGTSYGSVPCPMQDWHAAEYTDVFDQQKTNIEERPVIAANIGGAISRREDQLILDAMLAAKGSPDIADAGAPFNYLKLRSINALFNARSVPRGERKLVISAMAELSLLSDPTFLSSDYVGGRAVETGSLPKILGFDIEVLDERDEGGLPFPTAGKRTHFAWDKRAVGLGIAIDGRVAVDWIPEKTSWLANQNYSAGGCVIDPLGVIRIDTTEAALPT